MTEAGARPRRGGRPSRGDVRERAILDAALGLLADTPLASLTVEAIANAAGLSRASLYFYFASKDDLALALARRSMDVLTGEAQAVAADARLDPSAGIELVVGRTEALWRSHGPILRLLHDHADRDDELGALWRETMDADIAAAAAVLRRAGAPASGAASHRALATLLCHMTADAFARSWSGAAATASSRRLEGTSRTVLVVWRSVMAAAARDAAA